jgi:hypothetical protein
MICKFFYNITILLQHIPYNYILSILYIAHIIRMRVIALSATLPNLADIGDIEL